MHIHVDCINYLDDTITVAQIHGGPDIIIYLLIAPSNFPRMGVLVLNQLCEEVCIHEKEQSVHVHIIGFSEGGHLLRILHIQIFADPGGERTKPMIGVADVLMPIHLNDIALLLIDYKAPAKVRGIIREVQDGLLQKDTNIKIYISIQFRHARIQPPWLASLSAPFPNSISEIIVIVLGSSDSVNSTKK